MDYFFDTQAYIDNVSGRVKLYFQQAIESSNRLFPAASKGFCLEHHNTKKGIQMKKALLSKLAASLLLTAGLCAASAPASADTTNLTFDSYGNAGFHVSHIPGSGFMDDFLFTVDPGLLGYPSGTAVVGKTWIDGSRLANYGINSINFFRVEADSSYTMLPTTFTSGMIEFYPVSALISGKYGFRVTGSTLLTDMGGAYAGNLNLTTEPVPEPATYLMLLIGVGLLAFTSKAREDDKLG